MTKQRAMAGHDFPLCAACKHLRKMGDLDGIGWTCAAFPVEIPVTIVDGTDDHHEPYPGDNGIRFEEAAVGDGKEDRKA